MARTLPLLDVAQRRAFDSPPAFTAGQQHFFFAQPEWDEPLLRVMSAVHMRGGFLLQLGYFKAAGRFFPVERVPGKACLMAAANYSAQPGV